MDVLIKKMCVYEFCIFEVRDEEVIAERIIRVNYANYAVTKRKLKKTSGSPNWNPDLCDTCIA